LPSPTLQREQQLLLIIPLKGESLLIDWEMETVMDSRSHLSFHLKQGGLPHTPAMNQTLYEPKYNICAVSTMLCNFDTVYVKIFIGYNKPS
jgi:hypothetical protein